MPRQVDRFAEDANKVKWVIHFQDSTAAPIESAVLCDFCLDFGFNLERLFNIREGYSRKDDVLPGRFLEPMPEGNSKGQTFDVNRMLGDYYKMRGWDEQGVPTPEGLNSLSLS